MYNLRERMENIENNRNATKVTIDENVDYKETFRIREEQYKLRETRFYPEKSLDNTYIQLSDKKYGLNFNGKGYCDSYEDAVSVIERYKISQDNTIIKEIIHEYND